MLEIEEWLFRIVSDGCRFYVCIPTGTSMFEYQCPLYRLNTSLSYAELLSDVESENISISNKDSFPHNLFKLVDGSTSNIEVVGVQTVDVTNILGVNNW